MVSFGKIMHMAKEASEIFSKETDISVELIDLRTVRPMDYETVVASVKKTNRLVVLEEAWPLSSLSSELAYHIQKYAFDYLDAPVQRINNADVPFPYAPTLIDEVYPSTAKVVKALKAVCYV